MGQRCPKAWASCPHPAFIHDWSDLSSSCEAWLGLDSAWRETPNWALAPKSDFFSIALPETLPFGFRKPAGAESVSSGGGEADLEGEGVCDEWGLCGQVPGHHLAAISPLHWPGNRIRGLGGCAMKIRCQIEWQPRPGGIGEANVSHKQTQNFAGSSTSACCAFFGM